MVIPPKVNPGLQRTANTELLKVVPLLNIPYYQSDGSVPSWKLGEVAHLRPYEINVSNVHLPSPSDPFLSTLPRPFWHLHLI